MLPTFGLSAMGNKNKKKMHLKEFSVCDFKLFQRDESQLISHLIKYSGSKWIRSKVFSCGYDLFWNEAGDWCEHTAGNRSFQLMAASESDTAGNVHSEQKLLEW